MYGTKWCHDCRRSKQFLDSKNVAYQWIDLEDNAEATEFVLKVNNGMQSVPTIVFPDGSVMVEPSNQALAEKLAV
jgi:glutaredoxin-like protein